MAGWAEKGFSNAEWDAEAEIIAYLLHKFKLPSRFADKGIGQGFCRHYDLGKAGGGHQDPTTDNAKWGEFVKLVQDKYTKEHFPKTWARGEPV